MGRALLGALFGAAVVAACAGSERGYASDPAPAFDADSGAEAMAPCQTHCSRDLKSVVQTCEGVDETLAACGPDQGCGDGACVDACTAAAASKGSVGCEFLTVPPPDGTYNGGCFAAFIANTWDRAVTIRGELDGAPLDVGRASYLVSGTGSADATYTPLTGPLAPGAVAVVFLAQSGKTGAMSCPVGVDVALSGDPVTYGTSLGRAFRLITDAPVSAYSIAPYGGATSYLPSATLLLPTSAWTTSYLAITPDRVDTSEHSQASTFFGPVVGARTLQIIANEDGTEVRMRPTTDIVDGAGVKGGAKGFLASWTLKRGQVLQIVQDDNLTGSAIEASKPIALFGGAQCSFIPSYWQACDMLQQQIPPLAEWGSSYALVPYRPRVNDAAAIPGVRERVPWTIVGAAAGTVLTFDPTPPPGAPSTLEAGQRATFFSNTPVTVKTQDADHPIYVGMYMTGMLFDQPGDAAWPLGGDPDFVNAVPSDQFLDHYVFFADYTYAHTLLTVVRRKTGQAFSPVLLDCAGELGDFQPLGTTGEYEFTWVHMTSGFQPGVGTCGYGRHEAKSDGPFSITVFGIDNAASYGYAGGTGLRPLTSLAVPVR